MDTLDAHSQNCFVHRRVDHRRVRKRYDKDETYEFAHLSSGYSLLRSITDGGTAYNYPSAYDSVISVAAVDENKERAYFSQANDKVDIAAPGVSILSTIPVIQNVIGVMTIRVDNLILHATTMVYGPSLPSSGITAPISTCDDGAQDGCRESSGAVCVIERYARRLCGTQFTSHGASNHHLYALLCA